MHMNPCKGKQQINNNHKNLFDAMKTATKSRNSGPENFGHSNALQFRTLRFTCMLLTSVSVAQQPVVPADPYPSCFLTYMLDTKYGHGTTGCPAGLGPCGHINSAACANLGPVANYERPVALSCSLHGCGTAVLLLYAHCSGCSRRMQVHCHAMQNPHTYNTQHSPTTCNPRQIIRSTQSA